MALVTLRIGSAVDIFQYDDVGFDSAIETTAPIKAGTPVDGNDAVRLDDLIVSSSEASARAYMFALMH